MLKGGDPRTLGKTEEVVQLVLSKQTLLQELFDCLEQSDEIIRMRASDALEKVCRQKPEWLQPYKAQLLADIPQIRQASVQWHLAQIFSEITLNSSETKSAIGIMLHNLETMDDWIVTNLTLESLANFVRAETFDQSAFINILKQYLKSRHKSVVSRSTKLLKEFENA